MNIIYTLILNNAYRYYIQCKYIDDTSSRIYSVSVAHFWPCMSVLLTAVVFMEKATFLHCQWVIFTYLRNTSVLYCADLAPNLPSLCFDPGWGLDPLWGINSTAVKSPVYMTPLFSNAPLMPADKKKVIFYLYYPLIRSESPRSYLSASSSLVP